MYCILPWTRGKAFFFLKICMLFYIEEMLVLENKHFSTPKEMIDSMRIANGFQNNEMKNIEQRCFKVLPLIITPQSTFSLQIAKPCGWNRSGGHHNPGARQLPDGVPFHRCHGRPTKWPCPNSPPTCHRAFPPGSPCTQLQGSPCFVPLIGDNY